MRPPSILVVDDEPNNFDVIETLLSDQDYELNYISSGKEAIAGIDIFNPDLILLDVMMPDMDGMQVSRLLKASPKWQIVPIIMVTALNSKSDLANCLNAGADDFISKPINSVELRARVHSMLRIKQQYDRIESLSRVQSTTISILENTLNELRGGFASRLSHELNTPLNGIVGTIDILKADIENMDIDEIREMLELADQSANRLERLTRKFLIYLEMEVSSGRQQTERLIRTKFSQKAVTESLLAHASECDRHDDLVFEIEEAELAISERYLYTILHELLENALKFSKAGTTIKITSRIEDTMLHISAEDHGIGMSKEQIATIDVFKQFERNIYEQQGMGLGLTIVKRIIEISGGKFSIASEKDQGMTVHLSLPIAHAK